MKKTLTTKLAMVLLGCGLLPLNAQQAVGLYTGNHNAPYSSFQNPANTLSDLNRFYLNFWGANVGFTSNALTYNAPFGMIAWANGKYPSQYKNGNNLMMNQDWIQWGNAKNQKLYYLDEVYGPSVSFRTSYRTAIGFGVRNISGISMTGVNADLGKLFRFGLDSNAFTGINALIKDKKYSNGPFSINMDSYNEWYFSLAGATKNKGTDFVKWGATGKLLTGTGNAYLGGNSFDYTLKANNKVEINKADVRFMHTSDQSIIDGLSHPLGLFSGQYNGLGVGMDVGFVYEKRMQNQNVAHPDWWNCTWDKGTQYDWKFAASITDLGFIGYKGSSRRMDVTQTKTWTMNDNTLNNWNAFGQDRFTRADNGFFDDSAIQAGIGTNYTVLTPAAINAQLDMNLGNNFFLGVNWRQSLKGQNSLGLRKTSYINFVPRWESEHFEVGMPVTITRDYTALNVGLYGRMGPVIIGTDNLAGLAKFTTNTAYQSANIYFAVRMQIPTCGWYHYDTYDSIQKKDSVYKTDTVSFWQKDTIRITKHDTIIKTRVVRDTIIKSVTYSSADLKKREDEVAKKEAAIAQKDAELKKREADVKNKENTNMGATGNCQARIKELEDELQRQRDQYARLITQNQQCTDDKIRLEASIRDLQNQLIILRKQNGDLNTENVNLHGEIDRLKAEIVRLKVNNNPCGAQVKTLDSLLALEQRKNADLNKNLSEQKAKVAQQETDLANSKKRITQLEADLALAKQANNGSKDCDEKIKLIQADLDAEKTKTANLSKQMAKVQGQKDSVVAENATLKAKVTSGDAANADLKKQLDDLRKEYNYELDQNKKLTEQLKNCGSNDEAIKLKADLDASNKKVADLTAQLAKVTADKETLATENVTLKAKVSQLEKDLADLKAKLDDQDKTIADLQNKLKNCGNADDLAKAQADLATANAKIKDLQDKVDDLSKAKALLESDLSAAKAKVSDLTDQLAKCSSSNCDDVKAELETWKGKYATLKEEYDALLTERNIFKADLDKCKADLANCSGNSSDADALKAEIAKLKTTITELNGQVASKQKSLDDLQDAYDKLSGDNNTMKKQMADLQGQVTALNAQVADLQVKLKACQTASGGGGN